MKIITLLLGVVAVACFTGGQSSKAADARVSPGSITHEIVEARYRRGQELARAGRKQEALKEFLWCYDEGMVAVSSYVGVRSSFLLAEIEKLGSVASASLRARRDVAQERLLAGGKNAAEDFVALNRTLQQDRLTMAVYDQLPPGDNRRKMLANAAYELLISQQRYADAAQARNYGGMSSLFEMRVQRVGSARTDENIQQRKYIITSTASNIEVLAGAGDLVNARNLAERLLAFDGSTETKAILQQHLMRAGQPALLAQNSP